MDHAMLRPQPDPPQMVGQATAHRKWSTHYNAVARATLHRRLGADPLDESRSGYRP